MHICRISLKLINNKNGKNKSKKETKNKQGAEGFY